MTLDGYGTNQIASALFDSKVLTPIYYWESIGIKRAGKVSDREPHRWNSFTISKILAQQEYCGDVINFKSYKNKKRIINDPENVLIFKDVHEPVIDRKIWEQVQQRRGKIRKRVTDDGEKNMFSGLLVCADCGGNLNYHFNQANREIQYFNCANNNRSRKTCFQTHYVRVDFLEEVVLGEIRRLTRFAVKYEDEFVKSVIGHSQQVAEEEQTYKQKELKALQKRDGELDTLFERIYEDNINGKISDERFAKMSSGYETEQAELSESIKVLKESLSKSTDQTMTTDIFMATVRKYTRARKLTQRMLNELVDYIEVYHAEKIDGVKTQRLKIHYNCVGTIEIPEILPLPKPEVLIQTRKGCSICYPTDSAATSPSRKAIHF